MTSTIVVKLIKHLFRPMSCQPAPGEDHFLQRKGTASHFGASRIVPLVGNMHTPKMPVALVFHQAGKLSKLPISGLYIKVSESSADSKWCLKTYRCKEQRYTLYKWSIMKKHQLYITISISWKKIYIYICPYDPCKAYLPTLMFHIDLIR